MDIKTELVMAENLLKNTGKSLTDWVKYTKENSPFSKHSEIVSWLKSEHDLGLFFADLIVHKANETDANSFSEEELIEMQYKGKENLKPIYDVLYNFVIQLGTDIEVVPKKAYVSLKTKKQFACFKPSTKTRFELELILKNQEPVGILEHILGKGAMCTHKIKITDISDITDEVLEWLKLSYNKSK
ncbi:MAG: DUF5655 domain-containing protein [Cytophagales bacterium]